MTSDAFFEKNTGTFDLIFLDGLHTYDQLRKDVENALNVAAAGGFIDIHDLVPCNWKEEHIPRLSGAWTGDVWKVGIELAETPDIDFTIVMIDHGVGIIRLGDTPVKERPASLVDLRAELREASFKTFLAKFPDLPKVSWEEFPNWLERSSVSTKG